MYIRSAVSAAAFSPSVSRFGFALWVHWALLLVLLSILIETRIRLPISQQYKLTSHFTLFPSYCRFWLSRQGVSFFNTFIRGEPQTQDYDILRKKTWKLSIVLCEIYFEILNRLVVAHECDGQADGRTDRCSQTRAETIYVVYFC